jgi:hypothetical protein
MEGGRLGRAAALPPAALHVLPLVEAFFVLCACSQHKQTAAAKTAAAAEAAAGGPVSCSPTTTTTTTTRGCLCPCALSAERFGSAGVCTGLVQHCGSPSPETRQHASPTRIRF